MRYHGRDLKGGPYMSQWSFSSYQNSPVYLGLNLISFKSLVKSVIVNNLHYVRTTPLSEQVFLIFIVRLKPMNSFGMWWKSNEIIFLHWIIPYHSSLWIVHALSIVCSEMLKLSRNNQNIRMFGGTPNTLPLVIHTDILFLVYTLQHVIQNNCWWVLPWWYGPLSKVKIEKILTNLPKLSCGFKAPHSFEIESGLHVWMIH